MSVSDSNYEADFARRALLLARNPQFGPQHPLYEVTIEKLVPFKDKILLWDRLVFLIMFSTVCKSKN